MKNVEDLKTYFEKVFFQKSSRFEFLEIGDGTSLVKLSPSPEDLRPGNTVSGPVMFEIADCAFYVFSYLISEKNLKENDCKEIFLNILENEKKNGLSDEIFDRGKKNFLERINKVNFSTYHLNDPFKESGQALYYWSPIADELKSLDKKIVLNSIHLKWRLMKDEFKKLTEDLKFN